MFPQKYSKQNPTYVQNIFPKIKFFNSGDFDHRRANATSFEGRGLPFKEAILKLQIFTKNF